MNLLSKIIIPLIIFGNIILFKKNILDYDKIFIPLLNVFYYFLLYKILKYILNRLERALFNFINSNDTMNFDYKMIMLSLIIPIFYKFIRDIRPCAVPARKRQERPMKA